jgi:hypothetical protein
VMKTAITVYTLTGEEGKRMAGGNRHRSSSNCRQTGYRNRAARGRAIHVVDLADSIREYPSHPEGSCHDIDWGRCPLKLGCSSPMSQTSSFWDSTSCAQAMLMWTWRVLFYDWRRVNVTEAPRGWPRSPPCRKSNKGISPAQLGSHGGASRGHPEVANSLPWTGSRAANEDEAERQYNSQGKRRNREEAADCGITLRWMRPWKGHGAGGERL